jgi:hypothetical protein
MMEWIIKRSAKLKEIASRLFKSLAMTSETFSFYYDALQLAAASFIRLGVDEKNRHKHGR